MKILKISDFDLSRVHYDDPVNTGKGRIVPMSYKDPREGLVPIMLQLNSLYGKTPFSDHTDPTISVEVFLPLIGRTKSRTNEMKDLFEQLDTKMIKDAKKNAPVWFDGMDKIKYKKVVRSYNDNTLGENGGIVLKGIETDSFSTRFYNDKQKLLKKEEVLEKSNCYTKSIVEVVCIWTKGGCFGVFLKPHQFRISPGTLPSLTLDKYAFIDDDSDNELAKEVDSVAEEGVDTKTDFLQEENQHEAGRVEEEELGGVLNTDVTTTTHKKSRKKKDKKAKNKSYNRQLVKNLLGVIDDLDSDSDTSPEEDIKADTPMA